MEPNYDYVRCQYTHELPRPHWARILLRRATRWVLHPRRTLWWILYNRALARRDRRETAGMTAEQVYRYRMRCMDEQVARIRHIAGWTGAAPARPHSPPDAGAIPAPASPLPS